MKYGSIGSSNWKTNLLQEVEEVRPFNFEAGESHLSDLRNTFWDGTTLIQTWDFTLISDQTKLINSSLITIENGSTVDGLATKIIAKKDIDIFMTIGGNVTAGNGVFIKDQDGRNFSYPIRTDSGNNYHYSVGMTTLKVGEHIYARNSGAATREGTVNIYVKPTITTTLG